MVEKMDGAIVNPIITLEVAVETNWLDDFIYWLSEERSSNTVASYRRDLAAFCEWFERANGQPFTPEQMNSTDARAWREYTLKEERLSPSTWNRRRATLAIFCRFLEDRLNLTMFRLGQKVKPADEQKQAPRWLNPSEERALMRKLEINLHLANTPARQKRALRDRALVAVMRYAGLRVEEVSNLEVCDLQISERKGCLVIRRGKRDKTRTVPLSSSAREALSDWLSVRGTMGGPVFIDDNGHAMTTRGIQKRIETLSKQTAIAGLTCHALRHTCAKSMLDAGRPLSEVQKILGHEKLETTARYVQPGREDLEEAVEAGEFGRMRKGRS